MIQFNVTGGTVSFAARGSSIESDVSGSEADFNADQRRVNVDIYPGGLITKDYNLLENKPEINGVTLVGNKAAAALGLAQNPLVGSPNEITPSEAKAALLEGRVVVINTSFTLYGQAVITRFVLSLIADNLVGATEVISVNGDQTSVFLLQFVGFADGGSETWGQYMTALAREGAIPSSDLQAYWSAKQDPLTAGNNISLEDNVIGVTGTVPKAALTGAIPYGQVDNTSTSTAFTATVPGITALKNGVCVMLKNGVATSASGFTINVNGLGAKPAYSNMAAATAETTIFNVNYTMLFVFDEDRVEGGCWVCYRGYDSNTNTIGYQIRTNNYSLPMDSITYRYRLLFRSVDGMKFVPANNSTSTNATAKRTTIGTPIDPFGAIVYYGTTASVAAGSRPGAGYLWQQYGITLGYSFNRTGAALTLTSWKPVYIKALPQASGGAVIDAETPYVQDLPTTNDGYIYIYLGVAYSATAVELTLDHPVYYHDGTRIRHWT